MEKSVVRLLFFFGIMKVITYTPSRSSEAAVNPSHNTNNTKRDTTGSRRKRVRHPKPSVRIFVNHVPFCWALSTVHMVGEP